jgi:pilus assembly protein CpaC
VKLEFTASISAGNIRLQVTPEVSTLDYSNAVTISGFTVPAISTRRADTEVELRDGQSFGIAGLLDQRAQALMAKIPGIGDLPVLGQLFRSKTLTRSNSELIVLVTPHLIDVASTSVKTRSLPAVAIPFMKPSKFDQDMPGQKELENKSQPTVPKENR